jgi:ligand-binding SRPBCC domain-containing protein
MKIVIQTRVEKNFQLIFSKFNLALFRALKPPFMAMTVERFDGCKKGDEVHLRMDIFGRHQRWVSKITSDFKGDYEMNFVDEGVVLPAPLKKWKHTHRVEKIHETASYIVDDIEYTSGNIAIDLALYPVLYSMFKARSPIYKRELS